MIFQLPVIERSEGRICVTLEVFEDAGEIICGLRSIDGEIVAGPKAARAAIVEELEKIERRVKAAGCVEMRHAGENRGWVLPGYERKGILRNERRKRL